MTKKNTYLPDEMNRLVDSQGEQDRQELRRLVMDGASSPRSGEVNAPYFAALRARASGGRKVQSTCTQA
ncbi:hypothetical protein [Caenimonas koreensis]|uniref:hypothetical protein n=1 Tax=Caenimonas koreensis TaxID=367474 RepID=UPI003783FF9F